MKNTSISIPQNTLHLHGNLLKIHRGQSQQRGGGRRGIVKTLSKQSQARAVEKTLTLDWEVIQDAYCMRFVTLTTPMEYWDRGEFVYDCLDRMRRLFEKNGADFVFTRKEYGEKRGMLHYHMMLFFTKGKQAAFPPEDPEGPQGWIGAAWTKFLGYGERVRVESTVPECWEAVRFYVTKYCTKFGYNKIETGSDVVAEDRREDGATAEPLSNSHNAEEIRQNDAKSHNGRRFWYVWGSENAPWADEKTAVLDGDLIKWTWIVRRIYRKAIQKRVQHQAKRDCLPNRGRGLSRNDAESLFNLWCGETSTKRVQRQVGQSKALQYFSRGGHFGWRLWMNETDKIILQNVFSIVPDSGKEV